MEIRRNDENEHMGKRTKVTKFSSKITSIFVYTFAFYRNREGKLRSNVASRWLLSVLAD